MDASMAERFLIDGFPRDMANVAAWEKMLGKPEFVLAIDCPEEEMERRLLKRGETSGRSDDNAATIKKRFRTFVEQSTPVINLYESQGLVKRVSALGAPGKVHERVAKHFSGFSEVPDIVFVLGGPGSGKGTQCSRIANDYGFVHLSAGDLLRAEIQSGSKDGATIAGMIREGKIVPQEITMRLLRAAMDARPGCRFLIDGFPRALGQMTAFEEMVGHCKMVLFFDAPDDVLTERLLKRGQTSGRTDDNAEAIKKRLATYHSQSVPVLTKMGQAGLVKQIDATQTPDQVFADVEKALAQFKKQQIMLVLGQPMSGKTTLCKALARTGAFLHISSAELLKAEAMAGTELGRKVADHIKNQQPVPGEITAQVIKKCIASCQGDKFLIDGFPRKPEDAELLASAVGHPHTVLFLDCSADGQEEVMLARISAMPEPMNEAAVAKMKSRLEAFDSETMQLVAQYEKAGVLKRLTASSKNDEGVLEDSRVGPKKTYQQAEMVFGL